MPEFGFVDLKNNILNGIYEEIRIAIETYLPKLIGALVIIGAGIILSILAYKFIMYVFNKFKIIELVDKLFISMRQHTIETEEKTARRTSTRTKTTISSQRIKKISDQIKLDKITAKAIAYYLFLVFFRLAIVFIGIKEIEDFLGDLITYLPNLFIGLIIGFFGVRFANFIYDIVFHMLDLTKQKTAKIIATGAKIIILFFTLMIVLSRIGISTIITDTIFIGFISMVALAGGLAFGLGGRESASEILDSFKK